MLNESAPLPDDIYRRLQAPERSVLDHDVRVDGDRWNAALENRGLPQLSGRLRTAGRTRLARREVFELGNQEPSIENALQLLYYSLAWGLGTRAPRLHQRLDSLAKHRERAEQLLLEAWVAVRGEQTHAKVYSILTSNRGGGRIPWLGPAFSTKFLYFAQGSGTAPKYLILDQVVAKNLGDAWPAAPTAAWWPETYERYSNLLLRWAAQATDRDGTREIRADEIELVLFERFS